MKSNNESFIEKSIRQQQIIMNDERNITINEKAVNSVSKIMNWILFALLFITGTVMKNYTCLLLVSSIIVIKVILTIGYSYYYNRKF